MLNHSDTELKEKRKKKSSVRVKLLLDIFEKRNYLNVLKFHNKIIIHNNKFQQFI